MARRRSLLIILFAVIFVGAIGALQYHKYRQFGYNGLDLGIYTQVVWSLGHGHGFASSIHDPSYLGDHLELWLVPVAAIYRLWSSPLFLLWIQTIVLAISVWPLSLIARRLVGDRLVIPVAALWLAHPLLYNAALYEFHGLVFALPILCWSIWFYLEKRLGWWLVTLFLLAAVREDMPLVIAGWALLAAIDRRRWQWWALPGLLAVGWFLTAQAIIRQAGFLGDYKYLAFYRWLGSTPAAMASFPFRHPIIFLQHVGSAFNWQTTISFVVAFGLLPLLGGRVLWPLLFSFAQLLLLGADAESVLRLHYVIPYLPFLAWAALVGLQRLRQGIVLPRLDRSIVMTMVGIIAIIGPLYTHLIFGAAEWPWQPRPYRSVTDERMLKYFVDHVRPSERVITTFNLLPSVANRPNIYSLNYLYLGRRQYTETPYHLPGPVDVALIDWQQYYDYQFIYKTTKFRGLTGPQRMEQLLADQKLQLVAWIDSVAMYRRDGHDSYVPTSQVDGKAPNSSRPLTVLEKQIAEPETIPELPRFRQIPLAITWWLNETIDEPLSLRFRLWREKKMLYQSIRLLGQGTKPSWTWSPQNAWRTDYRLAIPTKIHGDVRVVADILKLNGRMRLDRWRGFSPVVTKAESLLTIDLGRIQL